jgi:hypothetical protein
MVQWRNTVMKKFLSITISVALTFFGLILFFRGQRTWMLTILWAFHLIPIVLIGVPLWYFGRHRVSWNIFDFLIIIVPFIVWFRTLMLPAKGMGNLVEPLVLGCFLPLSPVTRVLMGQKVSATILSACLLVLLCLVAIALYVFVPRIEMETAKTQYDHPRRVIAKAEYLDKGANTIGIGCCG